MRIKTVTSRLSVFRNEIEIFYPFVFKMNAHRGKEFRSEFFALTVGSDIYMKALKEKFPDRRINLLIGSYFDVPFGEKAYDAAVSVESLHHFPAEQKVMLYRKLHAALKDNGCFVLTDYFAESEELEKEYFQNLKQLKKEQGLSEDEFFHYDTPLTVEHETQALKQAGFSDVQIMKKWGHTFTLLARC